MKGKSCEGRLLSFHSPTKPSVESPDCSTEESKFERVPVTQEFLAQALASEMQGRPLNHPARECFYDALHNSIKNMVAMLVQKYSILCPDAANDLIQDCTLRILQKIHLFDPDRAKFTTWSWWVCRSVLNKWYRRNRRRAEHASEIKRKGGIWSPSDDSSREMGVLIDFADGVRELIRLHPDRKVLIHHMFGNPDSEDFSLPSSMVMMEVARDVGMKYSAVQHFLKKVVRPFFAKRLQVEAMV